MAYHVYVKDDGFSSVTDHELDLNEFPGWRYLGATDTKPDVDGKKWLNGRWIWGGSEPEYIRERERAYPHGALLLALWQAMDTGLLPKVPGFYDKIKEVNDRFPPT
jgi:hypothetical protein